MKQKILMLVCISISTITYAQSGKSFGIGVSTPDPSTLLHVQSDHHGVLIPNIKIDDIDQKSPINSSIKESLLVYNIGSQDVAKGYYYWTITTLNPSGKWVRVLTSDDKETLLEGQIQESFVEEMKEENGVMVGTGVFIYTPDKKQASDINAPGRLVLDIPKLVVEHQTLTSFELNQYNLYHYTNKEVTRIEKSDKELEEKGIYLEKTTKELELVYTDEKNVRSNYAVKDLLGANDQEVPAITNLKIDGTGTGLIFTNEKGVDSNISMIDLVKKIETSTDLSLDYTTSTLIYVNEKGDKQQINLEAIVKEPWLVAETSKEATKNSENIFSNGWVGIGLKPEDAKKAINSLKPDEKLRVNGSIYARNSYYADYVFENYFTNQVSSLKYDYKFNDLESVELFIKKNYHLPGITPIHQLEKSNNDGYLINVSELSIQLLEKVEELYLHTIDQHKLIERQNKELDKLKQRILILEGNGSNNN
jgi:hypothetical protein